MSRYRGDPHKGLQRGETTRRMSPRKELEKRKRETAERAYRAEPIYVEALIAARGELFKVCAQHARMPGTPSEAAIKAQQARDMVNAAIDVFFGRRDPA